ncbi:hypothetical protein DFJ73DRAFT_822672 [Zopfochytrium polystomum]|nr:hypothetical protein DFJ73DRAFT_822672 [Zopfochytrium polystomum]
MASGQPHEDSELLRIRTALLSRCTRQDLQLWVMMLLSVKLFLRSDEVLNLALDEDVDSKNHILWNNSSLGSDGVLEFLAFKIRGKSDKAPITLLLARDDAFPELCPIRALMHYVHTCNIKKGFLFPPADMLNSLTAEGDGNCASPISYESYNKRLKEVCERVIGRSARIGTHSMRKTAYFLAVWAGANEIDARQAARHATSASFVGDSSMAQSFMRRIPQHNLLHHARHFVLRLCGLGNRLVEPPIAETAEAILKYQDKSVTLNGIEKDLRNFGIAKVVIMQLQSSMPNASGSTQSDSLTTARIAAPTSAAAAISTVVVPAATAGAKDRSGSGAVQAVSTNLPPSSVTSAIAALSLHTDGPNSESTDPPPMERSDVLGPTVGTKRSDDLVDQSVGESGPPTKKKKRGGDIRLVARRDVLLARGASCILDAVIALDSEMKDLESRNKKSLVMDDDRQFYNRTRPFLCCFQNHFHSQRETFVSAVGTVSLTGFKKKCSGVGDSCGFGGTVTSGKSATHSPIN